uniref:Uncharacterized protein n=1 Tax=Anopheles coluzzii TaxID=1518534 RepID=A0A8W7PEA3_ANOCL
MNPTRSANRRHSFSVSGAPLIITTPYAINASIHCRSAPSSASTCSNENSFSTPPNPAAPQTTGSGRYHSRRYRSVSAPRKLLPKSHPNSYTDRPCASPSPHCTSSERPPSSTPTRTTFTPSTSNRSQTSTRLVEPPQTAGNSYRCSVAPPSSASRTVTTTRDRFASKVASLICNDEDGADDVATVWWFSSAEPDFTLARRSSPVSRSAGRGGADDDAFRTVPELVRVCLFNAVLCPVVHLMETKLFTPKTYFPVVAHRTTPRRQTHLSHLLDGGIGLYHVVERQLILVVDPVDVTPPRNLPQHQPERVHIRPLERIELRHVDRLIQHLRGHVALGADAMRRRLVDRVGRDDVTHRQPQVADAARQVRLHQYVLRLEVPVSDRGLAARTDNVHVQMGQPGRYRERHLEHRVRIDAAGSEKIEQRPILVIVRHQPELRPGAVI